MKQISFLLLILLFLGCAKHNSPQRNSIGIELKTGFLFPALDKNSTTTLNFYNQKTRTLHEDLYRKLTGTKFPFDEVRGFA
jgi:hypothetical protein